MKKTLLFLFLSVTILGCKKASETPDAGNNSYQPVSKGSYWKYSDTSPSGSSQSTFTMTGEQINIEGRIYYKYTVVNNGESYLGAGYFYAENGVVMSATRPADGESLFLKEDAAVGETWYLNKPVSVAATGGIGFPYPETVVTVVKLVEKGISHTVSSKTFTNVIHTKHSQQFTSTGTIDVEDYYIAKGVGMIERRSADGTNRSILVDYSIK